MKEIGIIRFVNQSFLSKITALILVGSICWVQIDQAYASDLRLYNQDGVMYLTTQPEQPQSLETLSATQSTATTSSPSRPPIKAFQLTTLQGYFPDFGNLISFILRLVMAVGALLVLSQLLLGGFAYITSGGEKSKTEAARNQISSAVIGLIILASSYAVLRVVIGFLGFNDINRVLDNVGTINAVH